jgi:hypothetical protein
VDWAAWPCDVEPPPLPIEELLLLLLLLELDPDEVEVPLVGWQPVCAGFSCPMPWLRSHSYPALGSDPFGICPGGFLLSALPTQPAHGKPTALPLAFPLPGVPPLLVALYGPEEFAPCPPETGDDADTFAVAGGACAKDECSAAVDEGAGGVAEGVGRVDARAQADPIRARSAQVRAAMNKDVSLWLLGGAMTSPCVRRVATRNPAPASGGIACLVDVTTAADESACRLPTPDVVGHIALTGAYGTNYAAHRVADQRVGSPCR